LKKLQLPLKDFRRLCIFKGIYPHEPLHKKKMYDGILFSKCCHLSYIFQVFLRKLATAKGKREEDRVKKLYERRPEYQLDNIVKERYPTFESALRDLDDALCVLFAFAVLPHTKIITTALVTACRRLTAEFSHYVIASKSLSKVFISIKGIYYEAEVMGERITWVVGHDRGIGHITEVDFSVMATFAEFYVTMLEFVNYRLYHSIGLFYPPQISFKSNKVATFLLNKNIVVTLEFCSTGHKQKYFSTKILNEKF
uniref:Pescadillo homolog n=1 Tax=Gongylonema pulchrum TaxID=637853 RepID=A0A183EKN5_9BILA